MFKNSWHLTETAKGFPKHAEGHDRRKQKGKSKGTLKKIYL